MVNLSYSNKVYVIYKDAEILNIFSRQSVRLDCIHIFLICDLQINFSTTRSKYAHPGPIVLNTRILGMLLMAEILIVPQSTVHFLVCLIA